METPVRDLLDQAREAQDAEAVMVSLTILGEIHCLQRPRRKRGAAHPGSTGNRDRSDHRFLTYYQFVLHRHLSALLWAGYWDEVLSSVHHDLLAASRSALRWAARWICAWQSWSCAAGTWRRHCPS